MQTISHNKHSNQKIKSERERETQNMKDVTKCLPLWKTLSWVHVNKLFERKCQKRFCSACNWCCLTNRFEIRGRFHQHFVRGFFVRKFRAKLFVLKFKVCTLLAQKYWRKSHAYIVGEIDSRTQQQWQHLLCFDLHFYYIFVCLC